MTEYTITITGEPGKAPPWKDIPGYVGYYQVNTTGEIRSLDRLIGRENGNANTTDIYVVVGRVLCPTKDRRGYKQIKLNKYGNVKMMKMHYLVLLTFVGPRPSKYEINHKNGDKGDNRLANLEYCTQSENEKHAYRTGIKKCVGEKSVIGIGPDGITNIYPSIAEAARRTGIDASGISAVCNGKRKTMGGVRWSNNPGCPAKPVDKPMPDCPAH